MKFQKPPHPAHSITKLLTVSQFQIGPRGRVYGIEHIDQLVEESVRNIRKEHADLLDSGRLTIVGGDGRLGYPAGAPYNAIHVGAAADELPKPVGLLIGVVFTLI